MDKKKYLAEIVGKEKADAFLALTEQTQEDLLAAGIKTAAAQTPAPKTDTTTEDKPLVPEAVMKEIAAKMDIPGLNEWVIKANDALEKVDVLEHFVKELLAKKDDDLADMIAPPGNTLAWSQKEKRPSQKSDNTVEEGDTLLKNKPVTGWLSEATGTKAIPNA